MIFEAVELLPSGGSNCNNSGYNSKVMVRNNDLFNHLRVSDRFYERVLHADNESIHGLILHIPKIIQGCFNNR